MASVPQIISTVFAQQGVPAWIGLSIAKAESGFNPQAVGDKGTSYGLFQLHYGGQANGYTPSQLTNPVVNTEVAAPPIKKAYDKSVQLGLSGVQQLDYVANHSGHPDYAGVVPMNATYDANLNRAYASLGGSQMYGSNPFTSPLNNLSSGSYGANPLTSPLQVASGYGATQTTSPQLGDSAFNFFERIDKMEHEGLNPLHPGSGLIFRSGEFLFGLILIAIGIASMAYKIRGGR